MSSATNSGRSGGGGDGGAATPHPQQYFCHQCNRTVSITPSPTSDLICPICNGGFLEEFENPLPNPSPTPSPFFAFSSDNFPSPFTAGFGGGGGGSGGFPIVFSSSSGGGGSIELQNPTDLSSLFGQSSGPDEFNPFAFLQNYLNTLRAGGANIQLVIENNASDQGGFRLPSNLGDYFIGPGLEQLIQQLAENDPNRYGTPPASKSAVEALPNVKITEELLDSDYSQCAVCKDTFELDEEAKQMPCKHIYHSDCILPWLQLHNSCPVCRYELPTDDQDYENRTREISNPTSSGMVSGGGGGGAAQENPPTPRTAERRFRITLPWPFSAFGGSPAETSNSGTDNNRSGNNTRESNSEGHPREEDLD